MKADLQVVALTIPFPANYGGVIDIYYRLKALHTIGVRTDLHCFRYNRQQAAQLEAICNNVYYYPRKTNLMHALGEEPYITSSRANNQLVKNINSTDSPVLLEGIHCTHMLYRNEINPDRCFVRIHNIEHAYYGQLALAETNPLRKFYFRNAARKLKNFETVYGKASGLACISAAETEYYNSKFENKAFHLPAFHPYENVSVPAGRGDYALYHGNLSIAENHAAALFLLREVAAHGDFPLVIAGRSPRRSLLQEAAHHSNVKIVANPDESEMDEIINKAHVHVLPTFQDTGVKLKLLAALFRGRFVVTNPMMTNGTGIEKLCYTASDGEQFRQTILDVMGKEITAGIREERIAMLGLHFHNAANALLLKKKLGI